MNQYVSQPWVAGVGLKMQSILLSGLRAPDLPTIGVKRCVRWMRGKCQVDADPAKQGYMQHVDNMDKMIELAIAELEYCTCHYAHHFADAMAVVAYHHPDAEVRAIAYRVHCYFAEEVFHFRPESKEEFLQRHKDKVAVDPYAAGEKPRCDFVSHMHRPAS